MSIFGWSYPPGAANDPSAPYNQQDGPCDVCGQFGEACICPECPTCQAQGDPACYETPVDSVTWVWNRHDGSRQSRTDSVNRAESRYEFLLSLEAYTARIMPTDNTATRFNDNAEAYALSQVVREATRRHGMTRSEAQIESRRKAEAEWEEQSRQNSEAEMAAFGLLREGV